MGEFYMKKILFATSEAVPFIKTGGLADVTGSLPRYFDHDNYDVRVILPKYACIDAGMLNDLHFICHFYINLGWRKQYVGIFHTKYKGITYYFIDNEFYFAGDKPYNQIHEDVEKFAFFSKAVLGALPYIDFCPDVIHCHDWQTGLIPVFLKCSYGDDVYYSGIKTVFSIHNLKFQGRWNIRDVKDITGLPEKAFGSEELESYGEANYLKGGCVYADAISTVSPSYAAEIQTIEGGEGLHGLMSARRNDLYGILNGLDYKEYNPETDPYIDCNFTIDTVLEGKKKNKKELQKKLGLPEKDCMMIGIVSRMTNQKGFDLIAYMMDEMLSCLDIQLVVLGTGEEQYQNMFEYFRGKYPDKVAIYIGYSEERAHQIYASSDAFLMPSLFEPCGLSQMMSMRYGTLPIVRETGGLIDSVEAYNEYEGTGDGFSFSNYNAHEMYFVIKYAEHIYRNYKKEWLAMMKRAMQKDFSWDSSARLYEEMYNKICEL